jgi:hypothetical protein
MQIFKFRWFFVWFIVVTILVIGVSFYLILVTKNNPAPSANVVFSGNGDILATASPTNQTPIVLPPPPPQKLVNPPEIVKAVYVTGYSAGTKSYLNYLSGLFKNTEINAVVVDVKGSDGYVTYASDAPGVKEYKMTNYAISDINSLVEFLHSQNIYVIGRIAVFEDPVFAKAKPQFAVYNKAKTTDLSYPILWTDNNGLAWMDPASKDVWEYDLSLAKDALDNHGFDEVNFDYIRFPTDGAMSNMGFPVWNQTTPKAEIIKGFFQYLRANLPNDKISVDLFGLTTVSDDDMGIGQVVEDAFENFDYISPMVYPSHYANGFIGFENPAEHPYEVIKYSLDNALAKEENLLNQKQNIAIGGGEPVDSPAASVQITILAPYPFPLGKLRPWLQDFNMGAYYTASLVKQEIKATQDSLEKSYSGYMLWNPSNIYTQDAILRAR